MKDISISLSSPTPWFGNKIKKALKGLAIAILIAALGVGLLYGTIWGVTQYPELYAQWVPVS